MRDPAEVVGGVRHGPFIVFTDLDGSRHAVRFSSVTAISDLDQAQDATLLQLSGGRGVVVMKPFAQVLGWFPGHDGHTATRPPGRMPAITSRIAAAP